MSSRRDVSIRITLLQRETLIEAKNRTLEFWKWHYSIVRSMKNVAVLKKDGAFVLFFRPHPGRFDSSRVPTPGSLLSKAKKKCLCPGISQGGGEVLGAAGIDWCIRPSPFFSFSSFTVECVSLYWVGRSDWKKKPKKTNYKKSRNSRPWYPRTTLKVNIHIFVLTKCTIYCEKCSCFCPCFSLGCYYAHFSD